jgi:outer membrane protein insertion porin family
LFAVAAAGMGSSARAQEPPPGRPPDAGPPAAPAPKPGTQEPAAPPRRSEPGPWQDDVEKLQGLKVKDIQVRERTADQDRLADDSVADPIVRSMTSQKGRPFDARELSTDVSNLWTDRRLVVTAFAQDVGGEVLVTLVIVRRVEVYERVEFRGLKHFDRTTVDGLLGLYTDRQVTSSEAEAMRKVLLARYQRDGYAFCSIDPQERAADGRPIEGAERMPRVLVFQIDEGPKVTIRNVEFTGNTSFPGTPWFGLFGTGGYLLRDSHIQSDPAWGLSSGGAYSTEILKEDLDRLRLFYRSRGFLEATVDVADLRFTPDRTQVDVTMIVVEGPRYRVKSVRVEHVDVRGEPLATKPLYSPTEIAAELKVVPGEYYDHDRLQRDAIAIREFYGKRGHPPRDFPGMLQDAGAFRVLPHRETYGDGAEAAIVFPVFEGVPKTLRDVVIRGNQYTRDAVIRRRIYARPGDRVDMEDVNRSLRYLEQTRYFQDQATGRGPRMQFLPVAGAEDVVDLAVDVEEGQTGELRWGVGISTGQGAQASITFNKRNFDLSSLPSSPNPATVLSELLDNKAFHGGGQNLNLLLAPGTKVSQFQVSWTEPDIFGEHVDTHELRVGGQRLIRRLPDGYTTDTLGAEVGLFRNFTEEFSAGLSLRAENVRVEDLAPDAPTSAFDAEGSTELRGARLQLRYRNYDDLRRPTEGFELGGTGEYVGGFLGGDESLYKFTHSAHVYLPISENEMGHRTVLHLEHLFGVASEFGGSDDVFLTQRFYMGGSSLRGFDYRRAGPSQFGRPVGGEAIYTGTIEVTFPLVATRLEHQARDRELLRGVMFTDVGLLGLAIDDPTFGEVRASSGFGLRIEVPYFELPISLDLGWPWLYEETDDRRQFFFSITR